MPPNPEDEKIDRLRRAMYSRKYADQLGPRERRSLDEEESNVPEDWQHDEKREPDGRALTPLEQFTVPSRPSRARGVLKWMLMLAAVFFLGALGFFVYYLYFGGASSISSRNIEIDINGPAQIAGGQLVNLEIDVTNHNREALETADLVVTYPPGTVLNTDSCTGETCRVSLGTIAAGGTEVVKLPAVYEGGAGQHGSVGVELDYRLGSSNSIFTATSEYDFLFSASSLSIAVSGNTQTVSGQPMQMTVSVSSNTDQPVEGVTLNGTFPFGFKLTSATPPQSSPGVWQLGTISPGQTQTVTLNGVLSGDQGDSRVFNFNAETGSSAASSSIQAPLAQTALTVSIAQPFLGLAISVDNSATTSSTVAVEPGDIVNVSIQYTNELSSEIDNAVVVAQLSGLAIDGTLVHSGDGFYRSTDNSVLWDKTTTGGQLATLPAGTSGTLTFSFQVPPSTQLQGVQNPVLDISVSAAGEQPQASGVPQNLQSTADQKIAVATDLELSADGLYFTDPFGAQGPMPPQAGVETTYAVALTVTNTTNEIQNGVVTATLPPYVRLVGNHYLPATEKVSFDNSTGVFTWNVGDIAAGVGLNGTAARQVVIEVGMTPSTSQIGSEPTLLQNITLTGTDASTGNTVTKTAPDVTTNITSDPGFSSVNAKVVAPSPQ